MIKNDLKNKKGDVFLKMLYKTATSCLIQGARKEDTTKIVGDYIAIFNQSYISIFYNLQIKSWENRIYNYQVSGGKKVEIFKKYSNPKEIQKGEKRGT